jgi:hypothetical protein
MWLLKRWPAARADIRDSSPASTAPAMIMAKCWAFYPGESVLEGSSMRIVLPNASHHLLCPLEKIVVQKRQQQPKFDVRELRPKPHQESLQIFSGYYNKRK